MSRSGAVAVGRSVATDVQRARSRRPAEEFEHGGPPVGYFRNDGTSKSSSSSGPSGSGSTSSPNSSVMRVGDPSAATSLDNGRAADAAGPSTRSKPGGDDGDADLVAHLVVDDGAEDDVRVLVGHARG